jgi:oxidoreductase
LDYVVETSRLLRDSGTKQLFLITAANANANSWFLYPQTKGLAEQKVAELGFPRLVILRPALLIRDNPNSERVLEKIASKITPCNVLFI